MGIRLEEHAKGNYVDHELTMGAASKQQVIDTFYSVVYVNKEAAFKHKIDKNVDHMLITGPNSKIM